MVSGVTTGSCGLFPTRWLGGLIRGRMRPRSRTGLLRCLPTMAGCLFALGACAEGIGGPEPHGTILIIDARPLLQPSPNGDGPFQGSLVSVLDRAELTVTPGDTGVSVLGAPLTAEEPTATFEIQVPGGLQTFTGRVLSNNGTVLYEGSREVEVRADGFAVELDLVPVAPV
ncbi:MAG: hypothetical protein ACRD2X_18225, partial [Vicinamibacteraceae bacterium]